MAGDNFSETDSLLILKDVVPNTSLAKLQAQKQKTAGEEEK